MLNLNYGIHSEKTNNYSITMDICMDMLKIIKISLMEDVWMKKNKRFKICDYSDHGNRGKFGC